MKKRIFSVVLVVAMLMTMFTVPTYAATEYTSGIYTYTVSNGTATITKCNTTSSSVSVPSTLGGYSVTGLSGSAFTSCSNLSSITIPTSVTNISTGYSGCWFYCSKLTSISVDSGNTNYSSSDGVLFNKTKTELLVYPTAKASSSYTIPSTTTTIIGNSFTNTKYLKTLTIPSNVKSIKAGAFESATSLVTVNISEGVTLASSPTAHSVFSGCSSLSTINIPSSISYLPSSMFYGCTSLKTIDLSNVIYIAKEGEMGEVFFGCTKLQSVTFSNKLKYIGDEAFDGCSSLSDVYYNGTKNEWNSTSISYDNDAITNATMHYTQSETYNVTYNYSYNGGTSTTKTTASVVSGNNADLTPTAIKSGWTFVGWNTNPNATTALSSYTVTEDITLYAIYKKTLTGSFYYGNNTLQTTKTATIYNNATSGNITTPSLSSYSGWSTIGWRDDTTASSKEYSNSQSVSISSDTKFYGIYSRTLTLSYNSNGGSTTPSSDSKTQYYNAYGNKQSVSFTLASAISKSGATFSKWAKGSTSGTGYNAGSNISITDNTTMYATWSQPIYYTISYDANGGIGAPSNQTKTAGESITLSTQTPDKSGYTFWGWTGSDGVIYPAGSTYNKDADLALTAIWIENETYTISYSANGGTGAPSNQIKDAGETITLSTANPTRFSYTFLGWGTSSTTSTVSYKPGDSYSADKDLPLYAVWSGATTLSTSLPATSSGNISIGGTYRYFKFTPSTSGTYIFESTLSSGDSYGYLYNSSGTELTKNDDDGDGSNFKLSYNLTAGTTYYFGVRYYSSSPTGTIPVKLSKQATNCTITYNYSYNGGTSAEKSSVVVEVGSKVDLSVVATKSGWEHIGWNTDSNATVGLSSYTASGDTTLYAIYKKTLTGSFYYGNNSLQTTKTVTIYNKATSGSITIPSLTGYSGWSTDGWRDDTTASSKRYSNSASVSISSDTKFYGIYSRSLTLSYNANGGDTTPSSDSKTQYYNAYGNKQSVSFTLASAISKSGYTFSKWAKGSTSGTGYNAGSSINISDNTTMYATWTSIPTVATPTISVSNINGGKSVSITCSTSSVTIYYTANGSTPTTSSTKYTGAINLTTVGTTNIQAIAVRGGYNNSSVASKSVTVSKVAIPTASPSSGTITSSTSVSLSCSTSGATIYYTINGNTPTTSSTKYTGAITINSTTTLKAIAVASGYVNSECMTCTYTYQEPVTEKPVVTTNDATNITKTSATLSGTVTDNGGTSDLTREFVYWDKYNTKSKYTITANSNFTVIINNLSPSSTYYYYAKATNSAGSGIGDVKSFDTPSEDKPQSITITPNYVSIGIDETYQLLANVLPSTATNRNVVWSTSDKNIVTVDKNGKVKGIREGQVTITATTEIGRLSAKCTVSVVNNEIGGVFDFSEWNMATNTSHYATNGFDSDTAKTGGNILLAGAYLARWNGAVLEKNDNYPNQGGNSSKPFYNVVNEDYHVQEINWIPARTSSTDNQELKAAVMNYGAVAVSFNCINSFFSSNQKNYYLPYDNMDWQGHMVVVVGWDDNYSSTNFTVTPPGNGAFICKNSWGENWGDNGYFYVSYYDKEFAYERSAVIKSLQRNTNYNKIYQYDPYGALSYISNSKVIYGSNVFPEKGNSLSQDEILRAVSFYTYTKNTMYEIYIVQNYQNSASLASKGIAVASGSIEEMGYHTIKLNAPITISAGTRFAVIVKLSVSSGYSYMYYEYPFNWGWTGASNARANSDESYYSFNGSNWNDLTRDVTNANFCIKAFTDNGQSRSVGLFSAIDNDNRHYESDKVYTPEEIRELDIPINPKFVQFMENNDIQLMSETNMESEYGMGSIPDIIGCDANTISFSDGYIIPTKYDLRNNGEVTGVRNQGAWGTCWAHAVYASLESSVLKAAHTVSKNSGNLIGNDYLSVVNEYGIAIQSIELEEVVMLPVNSTYQMIVGILPIDATQRNLIWSSDNEAVATVDTNGILSTQSPGIAHITVTTIDGECSAQCMVQVEEGENVNNVALEYEAITKSIGDVFMIDYAVNPSTATNKEVVWFSDNQNVITVNENGLMTALSVGTANVTVQTKDGNKTDVITIKVNDGLDCEIMDLTTNFSSYDKHLYGSVDVTVDNRTDDSKSYSVILAVYDSSGKMLTITQSDDQLLPGENNITFNNLFLENAANSNCKIKCFIWNTLAEIKPMSAAIEKNIE